MYSCLHNTFLVVQTVKSEWTTNQWGSSDLDFFNATNLMFKKMYLWLTVSSCKLGCNSVLHKVDTFICSVNCSGSCWIEQALLSFQFSARTFHQLLSLLCYFFKSLDPVQSCPVVMANLSYFLSWKHFQVWYCIKVFIPASTPVGSYLLNLGTTSALMYVDLRWKLLLNLFGRSEQCCKQVFSPLPDDFFCIFVTLMIFNIT